MLGFTRVLVDYVLEIPFWDEPGMVIMGTRKVNAVEKEKSCGTPEKA
jgi:hypothetical protein